ncbi:MAG: cytidylate kinase family protein [Candidatus Diapherotrites archaeon]
MKKMVLLIAGLSGTGKSNLCERLAEKFRLHYYPTSSLLKQLREKEFKKIRRKELGKNLGWFESTEGKKFLDERLRDSKTDELLDRELLKLIGKGNVVLDSWTMPWLSKTGFKAWLTASDNVRFKRLAGRDKIAVKKIESIVREKEKKTAALFRRIYGFEFGKDLEPFNLLVNTDNLSEKEVFGIVSGEVKRFYGLR